MTILNSSTIKQVLMALTIGLFAQAAIAELIYVQSEKARVLSEPSFRGTVISELERGAELELIAEQKAWKQVTVNGVTGWISGLLVSEKPPVSKVTHIGTDDSAVSGDVRVRASAVATAGATRGLTAENEAGNLNSDYQELLVMETLELSFEEVEAFAESIQ